MLKLIALAILLFGVQVNAQTYDVFEAKTALTDSASYPVIVFVHGGAWVSGDKSQYAPLANSLIENRVCVVNVGYSLAPSAKHPQQVEELDHVIQELSKKKQSRCWWDHMYLMGHSAGAHMIAMWNATHTNPSVRGFIGLEGIYDLDRLVTRWPGYKDWFLTKEFGADQSKWKDASPRGLTMKSKEPWLVVHSEADELVDLPQATDFDKALKAQGIKSELVTLKRESHFDVLETLKNPSADFTQKVLEFVRRPIPYSPPKAP